jgi:hypothetical protein
MININYIKGKECRKCGIELNENNTYINKRGICKSCDNLQRHNRRVAEKETYRSGNWSFPKGTKLVESSYNTINGLSPDQSGYKIDYENGTIEHVYDPKIEVELNYKKIDPEKMLINRLPEDIRNVTLKVRKDAPFLPRDSIKSNCFADKFNIVTLCDWHVPFMSEEAINAAFEFCNSIQPNIIILHELHDFYLLSKFNKDPSRKDTLQDEIDMVDNYLYQLRALCPDAKMILLESNHLDRLRRYLWSVAPALNSIRALEIESLLNLNTYDIEYMDHFVYRNFLFKHGNLVSKESGMSARRELAAEGLSGASGHTHRLSSVYRRDRSGEYIWLESGCLCSLDPIWVMGIANWQNGLSIVSFDNKESDRYFATVLPIIDGRVPIL